MIKQPGREFQPRCYTNFLEDGTQVVLDSLNRNLQVPGNLGVRESQSDASRYRLFSRRQRFGRSSGFILRRQGAFKDFRVQRGNPPRSLRRFALS